MNVNITDIRLNDYTYKLPEEKIAAYPLPERSDSKLLLYEEGIIEDFKFHDIVNLISENNLLILNNSRVIHARFKLITAENATVEVFLLEPLLNQPFQWKCLIGNARKWRNELLYYIYEGVPTFSFKKLYIEKEYAIILIEYISAAPQVVTLEDQGQLPLPPYIKRKPDNLDEWRYQNVFATKKGSVAAPTAALHFTEKILNQLQNSGVETGFVTLHVGAGTFMPVKAARIEDHTMHAERISVSTELIRKMAEGKKIIPVGTTTLRTLETLYWTAVKINEGIFPEDLLVKQWEPYELKTNISWSNAMEILSEYYQHEEYVMGRTEIIIIPGYKIRSCQSLITNFHQPASTLLLLVAACVGSDWKKIYNHALHNSYRFLSYGDSSWIKFG